MSRPSDVAGVVRAFYDARHRRDRAHELRRRERRRGRHAPNEWWTGGGNIKDAMREQLSAGELGLEPGDPTIGQVGDVAWFADRPAFVMPDGEQIPCRLTGVLRREHGEWKLVQSHCSIGVPNTQAFGS